jgi:branched-chain amino acid aminotransferase
MVVVNGTDSIDSSAALYGKGVFSTIAIYETRPFLWQKHWSRLTDNARSVAIDLSEYSEAAIKTALDKAIAENRIVNGRARITFFDEAPSAIWSDGDEKKTRVSIITATFRRIPLPFRLTISPYRVNSRSPLAGVKSCNYLENLIAHDEAQKRGFDEAIRLNENGQIASTSMSNVFWLQDGKLFTPALSTGCLPGTTREFVIENVECDEVEAGIDELENTDAIFLTSAGFGVVAVAEFEAQKFGMPTHPIIDLLPDRAKKHEDAR